LRAGRGGLECRREGPVVAEGLKGYLRKADRRPPFEVVVVVVVVELVGVEKEENEGAGLEEEEEEDAAVKQEEGTGTALEGEEKGGG